MSINGRNNRYETFDKLKELVKLQCVQMNNENLGVEYHKMVQTGNLDFHDYGTGFLNFEIYSMLLNDKWIVRIWIATIDDGDMGGWSAPMTKDEADELVHRIANEYLKDLVVFPKLSEINESLRKYGMYICQE